MSQKNTPAPSVIKVVSDAREEELLSYMRSLHSKMLTILQEVGVEPKFNTDLSKCVNEDYKQLHHQMRILIAEKDKAKWDTYAASLMGGIQGVVNTHMEKAQARKARYDAVPAEDREFLAPFPTTIKVPVSELVAHFPKEKTIDQVVGELTKLFPKNVGKGADNSYFLTVPFKDASKVEKSPTSEESAPISGEQTTAAAAE